VAGSPYVIAYQGDFPLPSPPDEVWSVLQHLDRFESWWGWLTEFRVDGPGLQAGSVLQGVVVPPLPYRIRVQIELLECVRPQRIDAAVHGDLEGRAQLLLDPEGEGSRASVTSNIEVTQRPLRAAARLAPGLLRWGHDRVVQTTVGTFRSHLREGA
jgi:carbon monoxide dehydrogenase subunit G